MPEDPANWVSHSDDEGRFFGEAEVAAEAFGRLPLILVVTEGPDLRTVAFNSLGRAATKDGLIHGQPLLEGVAEEFGGRGWPEAFATPTRTGETVHLNESRVQLHQPDGSAEEIYVDAVFMPRLGPDGEPHGTILLGTVVTDRVRKRIAAERELAELRKRYDEARGSVRAVQLALLADTLPVLPCFDVAARYVMASDDQAAGGDWFDAVARGDGSLLLVVGDVVGHGKTAAVAMGQIRSALLAHLLTGGDIASSLRSLDAYAATLPAARRATVCVVRIDAEGGVEYCTAGHPPPLLLAEEESETRYLPPSGAGPLATGSVFHGARAQLEVGEALVLYSDGILERPGVAARTAALQLRTVALDAQRNRVMPPGTPVSAAERICSASIELLTRVTGHSDDITMLAAQRQPTAPGLDVELAVAPHAPHQARIQLRAWLERLQCRDRDREVLLQAVTELVANVVNHAHLGQDGPHEDEPETLLIRARLQANSQVLLEVADRGSWKLPMITGQRGRGLAIVRQVVDELHLEPAPRGTTVSVRHTVARSVGLLVQADPGVEGTRDPEYFDVWSQGGPEPTVGLVGPLDVTHTSQAAAYLELALTEALECVTVDLSEVTLLASAGVDLLFRTLDQARGMGPEVVFLAPNGSPAQHVLTLVQLPFRQPSASTPT